MRNSLISGVFKDFIYLFFPRCCVACAQTLVKGEEVICTGCMLEMPQTDYHLDDNNPLKMRLYGRIEANPIVGFLKFSKNGRVQHLLHALKYRQQPQAGVVLGRVYGEKLKAVNVHQHFDLIIPVPLHKTRLRRRGYNQSAKFAEGLSIALALPFSDEILVRKINTSTQTRKSRLSRWHNVSEIFAIPDQTQVAEKRILLVDDVITTGATLEACALTLQKAGCKSLGIACIAVA